MNQALPWIFATVASGALFGALYALWASVRAALVGAADIELGTDLDSDAIHRLSEEKDALLQNLRDLRFDHEAGKLSDADFSRVEGKLRERAKIVMRLLDEEVEPFVEEAERLVAERLGGKTRDAYRQAAPDAPSAATKDDVARETPAKETPVKESAAKRAARRERERRDTLGQTPRTKSQPPPPEGPEAKSKACPSCDASNDADAVFCKKCGHRFDAPAVEAAPEEVDR